MCGQKDQTNGIFNRMALIPITLDTDDDFPPRIVGLTLGPQSPEAARNREQIEYMVNQKGIDTVPGFVVMESSIDNYR